MWEKWSRWEKKTIQYLSRCEWGKETNSDTFSLLFSFIQSSSQGQEMTETQRDTSNSSSNNHSEKTTADKIRATPPLQPLQPIAPSSINTTQLGSPSTTTNPRSVVPPTKRRKISIACHECRTHKTKCDGAQPICGSCRKKKLPEDACAYSPERGRRGVKNQ